MIIFHDHLPRSSKIPNPRKLRPWKMIMEDFTFRPRYWLPDLPKSSMILPDLPRSPEHSKFLKSFESYSVPQVRVVRCPWIPSALEKRKGRQEQRIVCACVWAASACFACSGLLPPSPFWFRLLRFCLLWLPLVPFRLLPPAPQKNKQTNCQENKNASMIFHDLP